MPNPYEIDENKTEFNSNHLTIYRLHKTNELSQQFILNGNYFQAYLCLCSFYAEIEPKLKEYKKKDYVSIIEQAKSIAEKVVTSHSLPTTFKHKKLSEFRSAIYDGANAVGVGMTTKDMGRGAVQYG